jgi:integrase
MSRPTCYVFRRKRRRGGMTRTAAVYRARIGLAGERPQEHRLGVTDKRVAEQRAQAILRQLEQERYGLIAPRSMRDASTRSFEAHQREYLSDLRALGRAEGYVYTTGKRLTRLRTECGWNVIADVRPETFTTWRAAQNGCAVKTLNDYLATARAFLAWLRRQRRMSGDPLEGVGKANARGKRKRERRALTEGEQGRLLAVSGARRGVYLLALVTGLRRSEIDSLKVGDIVTARDGRAVLRVRASTTKNAKAAALPLRDDVVASLDLARPPAVGLFPDGVPAMETFKRDLEAAGIPFVDESGRRADFHALRHTMVTNMQARGVPARVAQEYARHSDPRLTASVYTDSSQLPVWDAVERLPRYAEGGTLEGTHGVVAAGRGEAEPDSEAICRNDTEMPAQHDDSCDVAGLVASGQDAGSNSPTRTRT